MVSFAAVSHWPGSDVSSDCMLSFRGHRHTSDRSRWLPDWPTVLIIWFALYWLCSAHCKLPVCDLSVGLQPLLSWEVWLWLESALRDSCVSSMVI